MESVAAFAWNGWQASSGISGRAELEYARSDKTLLTASMTPIVAQLVRSAPPKESTLTPLWSTVRSTLLFGAVALAVVIPARVSAAPAPGYYDEATGKTGAALKTSLHQIIDGHIVLNYTNSGNGDWFDGQNVDVWEALVYTDSACAPEVPVCRYVQMLYLPEQRHVTQANRGGGANDSWDREHVWPKSRGFKEKKRDGYTDLHHLRPADRNVNGAHSNYGYDVGGSPVLDTLADGSKVDSGARLDPANESFEPPDRAKGQIARMLFYMAVRYEVGDDAAPEYMPNLVIVDENKRVKQPLIGDLCALVKWNNQFGPTDFERRRNDRVMGLQGNRNPFIDEPGWVNLIWGSQCH